ncbi:MAG TPA: prolipoprotein diacylglyceryl transferase [Clostridiaceae bacterium]|nr:prolipoprotein diacylglyceryl transferase [Clostridiaceae bacterium]
MNIVEFPGLWGLRFSINPVAFNLFGIPIYWYGIIIASSILLSILMAMHDSKKFDIESDTIIDLVLYAVPVAIVTARLYYVIFSWDDFKDNLMDIFNTRQGGLAIYGAIIGAVIVAYIFANKRKIGAFKLFDFASPYLPFAQAIGRWGNFINQEAFGANTSLPWGMTGDIIKRELQYLRDSGLNVTPSQPVHPTFLYESLWNLGVFFILLWYRKHKKREGEIFFLYMILYGIGRFWIEGLRLDSLMLGNLRISQVLAALFAIAFGIAFLVRRKKMEEEMINNLVIGESKYGALLKEIRNSEQNEDEITENEAAEEDNIIEDKNEEDEILKDEVGEENNSILYDQQENVNEEIYHENSDENSEGRLGELTKDHTELPGNVQEDNL